MPLQNIKQLRAEVERLRTLAAEASCPGDIKKQLLDLARDMQRHIEELERAALGDARR